MNITIKVLKGEECTLKVDSTTTILQLKQEIEKLLKIPANFQKVLLAGRTLADENNIGFYKSIVEGTKLTVVIKKTESLKDIIFRCFRRYCTEQQAEMLTNEFMLDFEKKMKQFSLDDIERLASNLLKDQDNV